MYVTICFQILKEPSSQDLFLTCAEPTSGRRLSRCTIETADVLIGRLTDWEIDCKREKVSGLKIENGKLWRRAIGTLVCICTPEHVESPIFAVFFQNRMGVIWPGCASLQMFGAVARYRVFTKPNPARENRLQIWGHPMCNEWNQQSLKRQTINCLFLSTCYTTCMAFHSCCVLSTFSVPLRRAGEVQIALSVQHGSKIKRDVQVHPGNLMHSKQKAVKDDPCVVLAAVHAASKQ